MARKRAKARSADTSEVEQEAADEKVQQEFVDTESDKDAELERAARAYRKAMLKRKEAGEVESSLKQKLIEKMKARPELKGTYRRGDIIITCDTTDTIKVDAPTGDDE